MLNKIVKSIAVLSVMFFMSVMFHSSSACAADWTGLLQKIKTKYSGFETKVNDMAMSETMSTDASGQKMTMEAKVFKKGDKIRVDSTMQMPKGQNMPQGMPAMETTVIYDGRDTWMISPFAGKMKAPQTEESMQKREADWWRDLPETAGIVGEEPVNGMLCYIVQIQGTGNHAFDKLWIEKNDLLLVKAQKNTPQNVPITFIYSDFRPFSDWKLAYKMEMYQGEKLMTTVTISAVDLNTGLSDDLFNADLVKSKGPNMQEMMQQMMKDNK